MSWQILEITRWNEDRISRWNKVSTIKKKEEKMERKRFIRNYYNKERTYNEKHNVKGDENTWNEALLIKSSKLLMARSFSMSIIWKMLTGLLLSLSLMFTTLFQNQVEWILPEFFNLQHLYPSWFFSWHMGSDMKSLPENFSWYRSSDLFWRFTHLHSV